MFRRLIRLLFNRNTIFILMLLLQIAFLILTTLFLSQHYVPVYAGLLILDVILAVYICNTSENPSYKMPWLLLMLIFPLYTGLAYLLVKTDAGHRTFKKNYARRVGETRKYLPQKKQVMQQMREISPVNANLAEYLNQYGGYPVYKNYHSAYFPLGELMFEAMKQEIQKAKRYIFLEFFIIDKGVMWKELLALLKEKAAQGVDVRLLYDGFGTQFIMPMQYFKKLEQYHIQCRVFNSFKPFLSSSQNNRDHRKILVIDGHTAFTGGINIADEYINRKIRFGHWKDGGVVCHGEAAWSFTVMFLQLWHLEETDNGELDAYRPTESIPANYDGFIQPYSDSPTDDEYTGRNVYLDIISNAQEYVYIMTPYLVLDHELITALGLAAKKGVDVRLILPHIPDKWYVYSIAWSDYQELLSQHVRIFEYLPGFVHAKNLISDDRISVAGTINMDYRSLYLQFECAAVFYQSYTVTEMKKDFMHTLEQCKEITSEDCRNRPLVKRIVSSILRLFSPLM